MIYAFVFGWAVAAVAAWSLIAGGARQGREPSNTGSSRRRSDRTWVRSAGAHRK